MDQIKQAHPKARHHCYAFRLNPGGDLFRSSDDGEPSGTAGKPILGQIDAFGLTNVLVIVVRYFGGKLLGASGLITAYKSSARSALHEAKLLTCYVQQRCIVQFDYAIMGTLMDAISRSPAAIIQKTLDHQPSVILDVPILEAEEILDQIIAHALGHPIEMVAGIRRFDQLSIAPQ